MCLRFQFSTHQRVCILYFLKKSQFRCTLMYIVQKRLDQYIPGLVATCISLHTVGAACRRLSGNWRPTLFSPLCRIHSTHLTFVYQNYNIFFISVADPDPGSGAFLTPGSGIRNRFFPDPGSQTHTFESLVTIFWAKVL
jgi:hypothetical protein